MAGHEVVVGRQSLFRWRWFATRLHVFVVVFAVPDVSVDRAEELTAAAQDYAVAHKGGLPRGIQTGTATVAVFVTERAAPGVGNWFEQPPKHRFAALRFPVLVELSDGKLAYFRGRMRIGRVYLSHLRSVAEEVIGPALR